MADEPARRAVLLAFYGEDAILAHACGQFIELRGTARRQGPQCDTLDCQAFLYAGVQALHNDFYECLVRRPIVETARAAQEQRLPQRCLERTVARLDAAVLVRFARI